MKTSTIMAHAPEEINAMRSCIFESVIGRSGMSSRPLAASAASGSASASMEVDEVYKGSGKSSGRGKTETCRLCGKLGHFAKDCWWRGTDKGGGSAPQAKGKAKGETPGKFAGKCNFCGKTGHKKAECKKRIAEESRSTAAVTDHGARDAASGNCAIEEEDADFFCFRCAARPPEVCALDGSGTEFITLGSAGDCH